MPPCPDRITQQKDGWHFPQTRTVIEEHSERRVMLLSCLKIVLITVMNRTIKSSDWARNIKNCLKTNGFQDVWTEGRVNHEAAFLSPLRQQMIRFKQEWSTKISNSDIFSTYRLFKSVHQPDNYHNDITVNTFRDTLI